MLYQRSHYHIHVIVQQNSIGFILAYKTLEWCNNDSVLWNDKELPLYI